jgi:hypothetical protein
VRPFRILTRHFVVRLLDNDLVSPQADAHQGAALGLACLVSASTFLTVLMGAKYVMTFYPMPKTNAISAIDDMFLFVSASMIVLALAAVVAWDALVLDDRDETILGPLPIPRATIVWAKLASMGVLACVVLVALNGTASLLHPATVLAILPASLTGALRLIGAHAAATIGAGTFGFATVLAIRELARALTGPWWPAVSTRLQGMLLAALVATFLLLPGWMPRVATRLVAAEGEVAATTLASPPMWFIGLHQALAGDVVVDVEPLQVRPLPRRLQEQEARALAVYRAGQPASQPLASMAIAALAVSFTTALLAYLWNARRPAARPRTPARRRTALAEFATRFAGRTIVRTPASRAGFFFTLQTLGRSSQHRAALAIGAAVGLSMAAITLGQATRPGIVGLSRALLAAQTLFVACLLAGTEHASRLPAHLPSGWSVQLAWGGDPREYETGVRRGIAIGVVLPALVVLFAVHLAFLDVWRAIAHGAIGGLAAAAVIEARARVSHTLPFLTAYVTGGRIKLAPFWFGLVVIAAQVMGTLEAQALASVAGTVKLIVVLIAAAAGLSWLNGRGAPRGDELDAFTAPLDEATQLKL